MDKDQTAILNDALNYINKDINISKLNEKYPQKIIAQSGLLSIKPKIYVCNVDEHGLVNGNKYVNLCFEKYGKDNVILVCAEIENQIVDLELKDKQYFIKESGIKETGLDSLIKAGYKILKLETFFTSGPEETRAWTITKNCTAPKAAGLIHTDFEKGFIKSETVSYEDFVNNDGWVNSKLSGKMRLEGKEYIVKDGDVLNFRFNT